MKNPLISVIIPTKDRIILLCNAIESVLNQTIQDFELIIIDDASDKNIAPLILESYKDSRIKFYRNTIGRGACESRNIGIKMAGGEWIAFLDDDDIWHINKLECQLKMLNKNKNAIAAGCGYRAVKNGKYSYTFIPSKEIELERLLVNNTLGGSSTCIAKKAILEKIGGFDPNLNSSQDLDLWVRLLQEGEIVVVSKPLLDFVIHNGPRISNNLTFQNHGLVRFHFKHRKTMKSEQIKQHLAFICYIRSMQKCRPIPYRVRYLGLAYKYSKNFDKFFFLRNGIFNFIKNLYVNH